MNPASNKYLTKTYQTIGPKYSKGIHQKSLHPIGKILKYMSISVYRKPMTFEQFTSDEFLGKSTIISILFV